MCTTPPRPLCSGIVQTAAGCHPGQRLPLGWEYGSQHRGQQPLQEPSSCVSILLTGKLSLRAISDLPGASLAQQLVQGVAGAGPGASLTEVRVPGSPPPGTASSSARMFSVLVLSKVFWGIISSATRLFPFCWGRIPADREEAHAPRTLGLGREPPS